MVADHPDPGAELLIKHAEKRFNSCHARVTRRLKLSNVMDMVEELPYVDAEGERIGDQLLLAAQEAAGRPGGAIRMGDVIERIIASDNLEQQASPPARMPAFPTPQRAKPSGLNAQQPPFRRRIDSIDEEKPKRPVSPPRRLLMEFDDGDYEEEDAEPAPFRRRKKARPRANPFIDAEAGVLGDASSEGGSYDEIDGQDGFIAADNVEC